MCRSLQPASHCITLLCNYEKVAFVFREGWEDREADLGKGNETQER